MPSKAERPTVELPKPGYQPSKAEPEEVVALRNRDGSAPTMEDIARAVLRPVDIRFTDKPRNGCRRKK